MIKKPYVHFALGILTSIILLESMLRISAPLFGPPITSWNTMQDAKILKLKEFSKKHLPPKYLVMGNSTALIGFNPSIFDLKANALPGTSFNAAMNGSEIAQIRDFACNFIISNVKPKNLVIFFSYSEMAYDSEYKAIESTESILNNASFLYRYRNTFRDPMVLNSLIRTVRFWDLRQGIVYRWADNLDDFGYSRYPTTDFSVSQSGWNPAEQAPDVKGKSVEPKKLRNLVEIRDTARANGVELILGTVPTLTYQPKYRSTIKEIAEFLGVKFVQGNDALGEGRYFQDAVHLNANGSRKFSEYLALTLPNLP